MWPQQIIVAIICSLALQQVTAVVNIGSSKSEEKNKVSSVESSESVKDSASSKGVPDSVAESTEEKVNRREASLGLPDTYGAPVPSDTYLPTGPSNPNLPVPVYGVPDGPSNNIVYPAPPPDIPPPVASPLQTYGVPQPVLTNYGPPPASNYITPISGSYSSPSNIYGAPPSNNYGAPSLGYGVPNLSPPPKFFNRGHKLKHNYGPPRPQYGPPSKPLFVPKKHFPKGNYRPSKPLPAYGPPSIVNIPYKDNYSPSKLNINNGNFLSGGFAHAAFSQSSHGGHSSHGSQSISAQYGAPLDTSLVNVGFGASATSGLGVSTQYGAPPDIGLLGPIHTSAHYGPPEPSPNPRPPHPGAPAPPTPPDIKYDGWQPIPGLVSRRPTDTYGVPQSDNHLAGDLSYNADLSPPPLGHGHGGGGGGTGGGGTGIGHDISITSGGHDGLTGGHNIGHAGSLALTNNYAQKGVSDSYGAPLNTVTGSGGVVSSSGEDIHSGQSQDSHSHSQIHNHQSHHHHHHHHQDSSGALALGLSGLNLGHDTSIQSVQSLGYEIFPNGNGIGNIGGGGGGTGGGGGHLSISDSYSAPPLNSYAPNGPYAAAHAYSNQGLSLGGSSFGSSHSSHGSFSSHGSHNSHRGYKGLSLSSSGIGLIPPSGVYGAPSGQYGTPLFAGTKLTPPKHPVVLGEPVPSGLFESIQAQSGLDTHGHGSEALTNNFVKPPEPTGLYSLPHEHSSISFQNIAHGTSASGFNAFNTGLNIEGAQALTSYNVPLGIIDASYSSNNHGTAVGIDNSHPPINIDLTGGLLQDNYQSSSYAVQNLHSVLPHDCSLHSSQPLPSLSFGVPSANGYTASLSSLTTNIGGSHNALTETHSTYDDLAGSHSQKTEAKTNAIVDNDEKEDINAKNYGKSVAESFGPNSELIKSQSIDLNNIPLQGNLGSYTLQIQSSNGEAGPPQVSHAQVLNDGLLQSILAAIEQPNQNSGDVVGQPILQIQQQQYHDQQYLQQNQSLDVRHTNSFQEPEPETSESEKVAVTVDKNEDAEVSETQNQDVKEDGLSILDNNEIALYYSNDNDRYKKQTGNEGENKSTEEKKVITNGH